MSAARIVSLLPSATEILVALGLEEALVGISHECDYPTSITDRPRLTRAKIDVDADSRAIDTQVRALATQGLSVYDIDAAALKALHPDLIVTQDQCAVCAVSLADVEAATAGLLGYDCPIVSVAPATLSEVWDSMVTIAAACGVEAIGLALRDRLVSDMEQLRDRTRVAAGGSHKRVACLEWLDPLMFASGWTPELVVYAGGLPGPEARSADRVAALQAFDPEVIALIPCGFDLQRTTREAAILETYDWWPGLRAVQTGQVWPFDGNAYFNRPGPRLLDSAVLLARALAPEGGPYL